MLQFLKFSSSRNIFILLFSLQTFSLQCMEQKIKEVAREFAENAGTTRPALTSQEYLQSLNNVIENPSGDARISTNMNALIHRLEKHKVADLIAKEAGLSKFCDSGKERLYKAFAHILEAYAVAAHLPTAQERDNLKTQLTQEQTAKIQVQQSLTQEQAEKNRLRLERKKLESELSIKEGVVKILGQDWRQENAEKNRLARELQEEKTQHEKARTELQTIE